MAAVTLIQCLHHTLDPIPFISSVLCPSLAIDSTKPDTNVTAALWSTEFTLLTDDGVSAETLDSVSLLSLYLRSMHQGTLKGIQRRLHWSIDEDPILRDALLPSGGQNSISLPPHLPFIDPPTTHPTSPQHPHTADHEMKHAHYLPLSTPLPASSTPCPPPSDVVSATSSSSTSTTYPPQAYPNLSLGDLSPVLPS